MAQQQRKTKTRYAGVFRLDNGGWWIQATQRDACGRRRAKRRALPSEVSIEEAARERAVLVAELAGEVAGEAEDASTVAPSAGSNTVAATRPKGRAATTVADYVLSWAAAKRELLKPSTREHYADVLGRFVVPVLGTRAVVELTRADVVEWVGWAQRQHNRYERPYAEATLHSWYRVLVTVLRDAAAEFGIVDPTARVRPPKSPIRNVREGVTLTAAQAAKLLDAVERTYPKWHAEVFTLIFSGLRVGELYALSWSDLDPDANVIHVRHSVWRQHVGFTKTSDPRDIALTEPMKAVLAEHRARLVAEQHPGLEFGLVFPAITGSHRGGSALQKVLRIAGKVAGIPTRCGPQVMRRTVNTGLVETGSDGVIVRSQMGHTSERMTSRYAGVHAAAKVEAMDRFYFAVEAAGNTSGNTSGNT